MALLTVARPWELVSDSQCQVPLDIHSTKPEHGSLEYGKSCDIELPMPRDYQNKRRLFKVAGSVAKDYSGGEQMDPIRYTVSSFPSIRCSRSSLVWQKHRNTECHRALAHSCVRHRKPDRMRNNIIYELDTLQVYILL